MAFFFVELQIGLETIKKIIESLRLYSTPSPSPSSLFVFNLLIFFLFLFCQTKTMQKPKQIDESEKVGMVHNAGLFPLSTKSNYFLKLNSAKNHFSTFIVHNWIANGMQFQLDWMRSFLCELLELQTDMTFSIFALCIRF